MPIRFHCGKCRTRIRVPDGSEGKSVKCPHCGGPARVPGVSGLPRLPVAGRTVTAPNEPEQAPDASPPLAGEHEVQVTSQDNGACDAATPTCDRVDAPPGPAIDDADNDGVHVGPTAASGEVAVPSPVGPPSEPELDGQVEPDVEPATQRRDHLAAAPPEPSYCDVDEDAVADQAGPETVADAQEQATQPDTIDQNSDVQERAATEPMADDQAAMVSPATQAVPIAPSAAESQRTIQLSTDGPPAGPVSPSVPTPAPVPRFAALQVCAYLLWALAVASVLIAVGLAIWHPFALTNDALVSRRLVLLAGVGAAALFWTAAEVASAARRHFQDAYRRR